MAIRILHQPSGAAVGAAAYATGQGKARQRKQKYAMDLMRDERRIQARQEGFKYRAAALGGGAGRQRMGQQRLGQQAAGTWKDPLTAAVGKAREVGQQIDTTPDVDSLAGVKQLLRPMRKAASSSAVQIKAQRRANDRARRMGKPDPYPEAEPQFEAAETKEEARRREELEDRDWEAKEEERINKREFGEAQDVAEAAAQRARDAELENDRQAGKLVYSKRAQTEIDKLDKDLIEVRKDKTLNAEQKTEATEDINERRREINRWGLETPEDPNRHGWNLDESGNLVKAEPGRPADFTYVSGQDTEPQPTPFYQAKMDAEKAGKEENQARQKEEQVRRRGLEKEAQTARDNAAKARFTGTGDPNENLAEYWDNRVKKLEEDLESLGDGENGGEAGPQRKVFDTTGKKLK